MEGVTSVVTPSGNQEQEAGTKIIRVRKKKWIKSDLCTRMGISFCFFLKKHCLI